MSLAHTYAQVIQDAEGTGTDFLNRLLSFMKARGHLSLLPQIVRILERAPAKGTVTVRVAKKEDATKYKKEIDAALQAVSPEGNRQLEIDPRMVGGYVVVGSGKAVDNSFRTSLVSIYRNVINS